MEHKHVITAGLCLILVAACTGAPSAPASASAPPASTPTPVPATAPATVPATAAESPTAAEPVLFESERYGYSLELPDDSWHVTEFAGSWISGAYFQQDSPGVDLFERRDPTGEVIPGLYAYLATQPVAGSVTFDEWTAGHDEVNQAVEPCWFPGTHETLLVSDVPARVSTYSCPNWHGAGRWDIVESMSIHDGHGFAIYVFPGWVGEYDMSVAELQDTAADWLSRFSIAGS